MVKLPQEDLFEGTSMSFGEHLEELRICLFKAILGIAVAGAISIFSANYVVVFFQRPLELAMKKHFEITAEKRLKAELGISELTPELRHRIFTEHLIPEKRLLEPRQLLSLLVQKFPDQLDLWQFSSRRFSADDIAEADPILIAQHLVEAAKSEEASKLRRLWELTPTDKQTMLTNLATKEEATAADNVVLLKVMNAWVDQKELFSSAEFLQAKPVKAAEGATNESAEKAAKEDPVVTGFRELLAKNYDTEIARELNRTLIREALGSALGKPHGALIDVTMWRENSVKFQVLSAQEAFMIWMKAWFVSALVLASPWIFFQIWQFVSSGLYPHEKNYVYLYLPIAIGLFLAGAALAFCFVFQPVLDFLFSFNDSMNAQFEPRIGEWLGFVLILPIGFGVSFQLPLVMLLANRLGLVTIETYIKQWRMAILSIFIIAMVLTPADPVSMLLMAVPLCGLYVLGIAMCKYMPMARNPFAEAYEP